jgi:hypothetical protein
MLDPPLFGSAENHSFSTMQVNISPLSKTDLTSLGSSGRSHTDKHDDPSGITLLICISYLRPDTDPGKFYYGDTREWCPLQPFSLIMFRGTSPHGGTQAIARGDGPDVTEKRINLVLYPRKEFVNRSLPILYPCYSNNQLADYSFFRDGGACFGTEEYHQSWCTRELFRHFIKGNKEYGRPVDEAHLQAAFAALTGSKKRYIDPDSEEGKEIIKLISDANEIMESVRLPWKDGTKSDSKKKKPTSNGHAPVAPVPGPKAPQPPSQDTFAPVPSGTPSSHHATRSSTDTDHDTDPASPSCASSEPHQYLSHSEVPDENSDDTTEATDNAEAEVTETEMDISDATDDAEADDATDNAEAEVTETETDISDATDDTESDEVSNPTPLPTVESLAERLLCIPLFNHSTMTAEMARVQNRATLLRPQFSKRSPQLSPFLPKPSSLPLPDTDGPTLVEQLIQFGERCQWTTQKFEHVWFYEQALKEHFFFTLLCIEPLFDVSELTRIFKDQNRNRGAGVCSRALMDKIVLMVNRMSSKADEHEEIFIFDAVEILDRQYQPKFCASVQVTLKPYRGKDPYRHMAQHFREVQGY